LQRPFHEAQPKDHGSKQKSMGVVFGDIPVIPTGAMDAEVTPAAQIRRDPLIATAAIVFDEDEPGPVCEQVEALKSVKLGAFDIQRNEVDDLPGGDVRLENVVQSGGRHFDLFNDSTRFEDASSGLRVQVQAG
jgi:hypothetical protein